MLDPISTDEWDIESMDERIAEIRNLYKKTLGLGPTTHEASKALGQLKGTGKSKSTSEQPDKKSKAKTKIKAKKKASGKKNKAPSASKKKKPAKKKRTPLAAPDVSKLRLEQ